jgi:hypothetical protein
MKELYVDTVKHRAQGGRSLFHEIPPVKSLVKIASQSCLQSPLDFARAHENSHHAVGEQSEGIDESVPAKTTRWDAPEMVNKYA